MTLTYPLSEAAERLGGTQRWLADGIRAGKFPARKIGKHWRMTDADINAVLEIVKNPTYVMPETGPRGLSLTRTSRRRLA